MMNGVFHSLREEFDLSESYSGQAVLEVIVSTIKVNTFALNFQSRLSGMSGKKLHLPCFAICVSPHAVVNPLNVILHLGKTTPTG